MDMIKEYGILAIATRFKLLSDRLYGLVDQIFLENGHKFQARWYIYLATISRYENIGVMELAEYLGQTHPAISQLNKKMIKMGLIQLESDPNDERKTCISLTDKGATILSELKKIAPVIEKSLNKLDLDYEIHTMETIKRLELALSEVSLVQDVKRRLNDSVGHEVQIVEYSHQYGDAFKDLNYEWLKKYFYIEEIDARVLSDPKTYILDPGGYIYYAIYKDEVVGTCALIKDKDNFWELSKMAVTETYQGLKIGEKLAQAVIEKFRTFNSGTLFLESNSKLTPAIRLYKKLGFRHLKKKQDSHYNRADVYMVYFSDSV